MRAARSLILLDGRHHVADAAVGTDVRPYDLTRLPDGGWVVLAGKDDATWLVEVDTDDAGAVTPVPAVQLGAEVLAAADDTVHLVGVVDDRLHLLTGDRRTPLGPASDDVTTVLSPDGHTALQPYDADLAPVGQSADLGPDGDPAGLARADDGTAVATLSDPAPPSSAS